MLKPLPGAAVGILTVSKLSDRIEEMAPAFTAESVHQSFAFDPPRIREISGKQVFSRTTSHNGGASGYDVRPHTAVRFTLKPTSGMDSSMGRYGKSN
jgi:hypothetical protein